MTSACEQFDDLGYVVFQNVLDDKLMQEASRHIDHLINKYPDIPPFRLTTNNIIDDPFWIRLVGDERLLDIAEQFLGPDIALFGAAYFCKMPFEGRPVLWHQDGSYWPLDPMEVVTLWLAVDRSFEDNGCLRVIPRTHRLELQQMRPTDRDGNVLESEIDPKWVDESQAVNVILEPGDVSVHHPGIIHGSNANQSPYRRCGMAIRYIATSTRVLEGQFANYLLRGKAVPGVNNYRPRPTFIQGEHMSFAGYEQWI